MINDKIPIEFFRPGKSYGSDTMNTNNNVEIKVDLSFEYLVCIN